MADCGGSVHSRWVLVSLDYPPLSGFSAERF